MDGSQKPAYLVVDKEKQAFWTALQRKLTADVEALPDTDFFGTITPFVGGVRITLNRPGMAFNQTYTDVFYKPELREIRCSVLNSAPYTLRFCVAAGNQVAVTTTLGAGQMNADQASQHIVKLMLDVMSRK
jgi:hypothetical protein